MRPVTNLLSSEVQSNNSVVGYKGTKQQSPLARDSGTRIFRPKFRSTLEVKEMGAKILEKLYT